MDKNPLGEIEDSIKRHQQNQEFFEVSITGFMPKMCRSNTIGGRTIGVYGVGRCMLLTTLTFTYCIS